MELQRLAVRDRPALPRHTGFAATVTSRWPSSTETAVRLKVGRPNSCSQMRGQHVKNEIRVTARAIPKSGARRGLT